MKKLLLSVVALGLFVLPAYATKDMRKNVNNDSVIAGRNSTVIARKKVKRNGIIKVKSSYSVEETARRFEEAVAKPGREALNIMAKVDHAQNAENVDQQLRPTKLFIFGNPRVGTPLMQCNQTVGIDLPQKALIWEDKRGNVWFGYNSPKYLSARHRLKRCEAQAQQALQTVGNVLNTLAQEATQ